GLRHRRGAVLPDLQPGHPGQEVRPGRHLRASLGAGAGGPLARDVSRADRRPRRAARGDAGGLSAAQEARPMTVPSFTDTWVPAGARAIALVLHGGAEQGTDPVTARSLSWRRGRALARRLAAAVGRDDVG